MHNLQNLKPCPCDLSEVGLEDAILQLFNETRLPPSGILVSSTEHQILVEILSNCAKDLFFPLRTNIVVAFGFPSDVWAVFNEKSIIYSDGA